MRVSRQMMFVGSAVAGGLLLSGCANMNPLHRIPQRGCDNLPVTFYFETGSDQLSDPAKLIVGESAAAMKSCRIKEVHLVGLADPVGAPQNNLELSRRRAQSVLDAYVAAGLSVTRYHMVAAGERDAINSSGEVEPLRRRVEATLVTGREPKG